jgi:hypothetical protein
MKKPYHFLTVIPVFSAILYLSVTRGTGPLPGSESVQTVSKYKYQGLDKCASVCHSNNELGFQYDIVKKSRHTEAYEILGSAKAAKFAKAAGVTTKPAETPLCLQCHTTGAGLDPSSYLTSYRKEDGITCEACHKDPLNPQTVLPDEKRCLTCHSNTVHKVNKFVYAERIKKIAHPQKEIIIDQGKNVTLFSGVKPEKGDGRAHQVGEHYGGGVVFYTFDNGLHGLIAATTDQGSGIRWNNGSDKLAGSSDDGIYAGDSNTRKIIAALGKDDPGSRFAAKICDEYSITAGGVTYDDWYLPSRSELNLLFLQKDIVGNFL